MIIIFFIFEDDDLRKLQSRDPSALTLLYEEYSKKVFNFLLIKLKGDKLEAEELTSETFFSVVQSIPKLKTVRGLQAWIFQIANCRFYDSLRKKYKYKELLEKTECESYSNDDTLDKLQLQEKVLMTYTAMEKLPDHYKEVLQLKYDQEKSQKEIACLLNKSEVAVESLLFKARKTLKKELLKLKRYF